MGIDQLGRFAEFDYINSDECIHRAMQLARKLNSFGGPARAVALASVGAGDTHE